jgi:hypothetical protein
MFPRSSTRSSFTAPTRVNSPPVHSRDELSGKAGSIQHPPGGHHALTGSQRVCNSDR